MAADWETLKTTLPVSTSPEDKEKRKELWSKFNLRKSKQLALFEVDNGIKKVLGCEELFDAKAVVQKAFVYAREINPGGSPDKVEFSEFRLLLCYLKGLFDIYQVFKSLDKTKDNALDLSELEAAQEGLVAAGISIDDPGALWSQLRGTNEVVDFHEFSDWAIRQNMGGSELLEKAEAMDREEAEGMKKQLMDWDLCVDGAISSADLKAIMGMLDPNWTTTNFDKFCQLEGVPIKDGKVPVADFVDYLFAT